MPRVFLSGTLRRLAGGEPMVEVEATDVRGVLRALGQRHPALVPHLEDGFAVAVDGEIFQDILFAPVGPDSEVHLIPAIRGG